MNPLRPVLFLLTAVALGLPAHAADTVTVPVGTSIELEVQTPFSSSSGKAGDRFSARTVSGVAVEGHLAIPAGTVVTGQLKKVRAPQDGAKSAAMALKFERIQLPQSPNADIEGQLTSLKADERRRILDEWARLSTGYMVDVVLIGAGTEADLKVSTLVGVSGLDRGELVDTWAKSGLGPDRVDVTAGTRLTMELEKALTVPVASSARGKADRNIYVSAATIREAQVALKGRGLYTGEANGLLDRPTRNALARFQIDRGQPPTGDADEGTLRELKVMVTAK
jgi:hypothetical protein